MNILETPQSRDHIGVAQEQPPRKLGIAGVEDVPWGTHICQVYTTQTDLLDILTPYFSEGLKSNEFCLWITAEPLGAAAAKAALHRARGGGFAPTGIRTGHQRMLTPSDA